MYDIFDKQLQINMFEHLKTGKKSKWSKYLNHKSKLVSHLNIDNSEVFDTQTWTLKQRCDQVPKDINITSLCIRGISQRN